MLDFLSGSVFGRWAILDQWPSCRTVRLGALNSGNQRIDDTCRRSSVPRPSAIPSKHRADGLVTDAEVLRERAQALGRRKSADGRFLFVRELTPPRRLVRGSLGSATHAASRSNGDGNGICAPVSVTW